MRRLSAQARCAALGLLGLLPLAALAPAAGPSWGTIKGQVVCDGPIPKREPVKVDKDEKACLKNGPLLSEKFLANPKNKGVRYVVVWLIDATNPMKPLPIAPARAALARPTVEIDQPCCMFEPRVVALRQGQTLVIKNSAAIPHNAKLEGGPLGPSINPIMPAGSKIEVKDIVARPSPILLDCSIHGWMKGYIRVFNHPYFAVTDEDGNFEIKDAPAGKYRLVAWHESGWVTGDTAPSKNGKVIDIKAGGVTDLGKIPMKPPED
jgi:hypothetical protein